MMSENRPFDDLRSLAEHLREHVPPIASEQAAAAAIRKSQPRRRGVWVAVVIFATLMAASNVALAQAANSSIPGDFLYPLDRAYEWIGDRFAATDRLPERVDEALALTKGGNTAGAASLVDDIGIESQNPALRESIDELRRAAQSGDHEELEDAIVALKADAAEVAEANRENDNAPSLTAPGQVDDPPTDSPSDTAPGRVDDPPEDSPSDTASGQTKEKDKTDGGGGGGQSGGRGRSNP